MLFSSDCSQQVSGRFASSAKIRSVNTNGYQRSAISSEAGYPGNVSRDSEFPQSTEYFPHWSVDPYNRWLGIRLDLCASSVSFATAVFMVLFRGNIDSGIAGLCLAYALQSTQSLNALIRSSADIEVNIVSVERMAEYIALESEVRGDSSIL